MGIRHRVEVVAECGINFQGDLDIAKTMIHIAHDCGADTAKFQVYDPRTTLDREHPVIEKWWDVILSTELSLADVKELKAECDEVGIEFLASVFDVERVGWLEEVGVKRYKIASRSMYDRSLAEAIAETGKPVIVSWGYYDLEQGGVPSIFRCFCAGYREILSLYCIAKYPTPLSDLNFFDSDWPTGREWSMFDGGRYVGFSDHTIGIGAAAMAMSLGAKIIEKHFTLDRGMPGPDHVCSVEPDELAQLCQIRDQIEEIPCRD